MVMMSVGCGHQSWLDKGPEVAVKGMMGIVTAVNANRQTQCSRQHPPAPLPYLSRLTALCLPADDDLSSHRDTGLGDQKNENLLLSFLYSPSVLRSTLPHSVPPESCCLLSACCSSAKALPPPLQMASVPRGTPGLGEGRKVEWGNGSIDAEEKNITERKIEKKTVCNHSSALDQMSCKNAQKWCLAGIIFSSSRFMC